MKLAPLSIQPAAHGWIPQTHGMHPFSLHDLRSKSEHLLLGSLRGGCPLTTNFGYQSLQFPLISRRHLHRCLKVYAKAQENDDHESNSSKIYKETPHSSTQKSESDLSSEVFSTDLSTPELEEDSEPLPISAEENLQYRIDYQVFLDKLKAVLLHVLASEQWNASRLNICHRNYLISAKNLIHYLALHCLDIQQLSDDLSSIGLLSLDCSKSHILGSITSAIQLLEKKAPSSYSTELIGWNASAQEYATSQEDENKMKFNITYMRAKTLERASVLFGTVGNKKNVNIMVTVGKEAITKQMLLHDLLKAGANMVRVNCAHDDSSAWSEIIRRAKHSSQMLEKPCRVLMDLAGPKLRTGVLGSGPNVMKISPKKDAKGDVIVPAQIWLSFPECSPPSHVSPDALLSVENERFLNKLETGDIIRFVDARGRKRSFSVCRKYSVFAGYGYMVECRRTTYVESGTRLRIERKKCKDSVAHVVNVPAAKQFVRLRVGDLLTICREPSLSTTTPEGTSVGAQKITCDSQRLFDSVKPGEPIAFDDGKIWGVIQGLSNNEIVVSITHASPKGSKLGSGKSINIPESTMQFEGLTSKDLQDLDFVASNADMVGISFIRDTHDVDVVMQELVNRKLQHLGVVLKIETQHAFEKLPLLLLKAMQYSNPLGVMIARGDLAVECGWNHMASIQEEILSICSAAHIPVIWATQVLESLVKSGIPTRAEITDVATGMRANCIMLNKGKYIIEAVSSLDSILSDCANKEKMKTLLKPLLPTN